MKVNVGCGQSPTKGWRNFDNSASLRLARIPLLESVLSKIGFLDPAQREFIRFARQHHIDYGDATRGLPIADESVEALYSSHMLEHLDRDEVILFLQEVRRLLRPGGVLRLALPDLKKLVNQYSQDGDADAFIEGTLLAQSRPKRLSQRLRALMVGPRNHLWMYDGPSICRLLLAEGFLDPTVLQAGETTIADPQGLDLNERLSESVYVEAVKP